MKIENILDKMYVAAKKAYENGEVPVAAAIVNNKNDEIVSLNYNNRQHTYSVIGHAEILAILDAEKNIEDWRLNGFDLYVSLFPCHMCREIIMESRIDNVHYLCDSKEKNDYINYYKINNYKDYEKKFNDLLSDFFVNMR